MLNHGLVTHVTPSHHWTSCWAVRDGVDITVAPTLNGCVITVGEIEDPGACNASLFVVEGVGRAVRGESFGSDIRESKSGRESCKQSSDGEGFVKHLVRFAGATADD